MTCCRLFTYLYDFGDGWEHDVTVVGAGAEQPGCPEGTGACPPEDCGGPPGYEELLAVLADPTHDEHDHMRSWVGDLKRFDLARTDLLVRNTAGEVPTSVHLVLDLARDGVKLTPGGRLPRSFVRAVQERRPHWYPLGRPASVEEDLLPLAELHDLLRKVGLLRLSKGVVRPTKIADNDVEVLRRLRSWFTEREFVSILAGDVLAALLAFGPQSTQQLAARIHPTLDRWAVNGQPITERDAQSEIWSLRPIGRARPDRNRLAHLDCRPVGGLVTRARHGPRGVVESVIPGHRRGPLGNGCHVQARPAGVAKTRSTVPAPSIPPAPAPRC